MYISDDRQTTFVCLGRFLKKLAEDQCSSITKTVSTTSNIYSVSQNKVPPMYGFILENLAKSYQNITYYSTVRFIGLQRDFGFFNSVQAINIYATFTKVSRSCLCTMFIDTFWVKIFHSKRCCLAFNSLPLVSTSLHWESSLT